jgi:thiol-disulfide isomerase/thioredoxin
VAFAINGTPDEVRAAADEFGLHRVLADEELVLYRAFRANGTPSAVLIAADGTVASWVASGGDEIERLLAQAVKREDGHLVGAEVPALEFHALDGRSLALPEVLGRETLILFWNPSCGYCRTMHDDLLHWESSTNGSGTRLVVVSSGDPDATGADGFRSTVLLDPGFTAGKAFGARGTPSAVLVDADGRVASQVVVGADAVLALAESTIRAAASEPARG